jgi:CHRD domain-containing protein
MKRRLWLAFAVIPVLAFGLVSDVAAGQTDGVKGEGGRPFTTVLSGINEVPAATGSDLTGTAQVTINLGQNELCWDLDYTTTQQVVAAHIHHAPAGVAAGVIFGFFNPPASNVIVNSGCREGDPALLRDIATHPENYYVNVHTTAHPGGAGRGQLTK